MEINWDEKGLLAAVVQHAHTGQVLMLGYMNAESWEKTQATGLVTFYSRSRQQLWVKGETSGNYLHYQSHSLDCDGDAVLMLALPQGPVCHTGAPTCFHEDAGAALPWLGALQGVVAHRLEHAPEGSYTAKLAKKGLKKMGQKVGEEGLEVALEAEHGPDDLLLAESADLLFHLIVLLQKRGLGLEHVIEVLKQRHK